MNTAPPLSDRARRSLGFLTEAETDALSASGVLIPSPQSTLVSSGVVFGEGVVLWPGVVLEIASGGSVAIGDGAVLHSGTRIVSAGMVTVGALAEIGEEGGFTVKADGDITIAIGRETRLLGGGSLMLTNEIGDGAQIVGPIRCQNCTLGAGGSYRHPLADERGAVLKGFGVARAITLSRGQVIQAFGLFTEAPVRMQSYFHPARSTEQS